MIDINRESLKAELSAKARMGVNAKQLQELQGDLLGQIKADILKELAMATTVKQTTVKKFLWFTITEDTVGGLQHIEQLQSDLRVVLGYEALLNSTQNEGETAKMNMESMQD